MPIRAEGQRVNFPLARRQAPQRLTNSERAALQYQPRSSLLPVPALEASAPAPAPADHRDATIRRRPANTPPAPVQLSERILHDLLHRHRVRARQASKTHQLVRQRCVEDLDVAPRNLAGPIGVRRAVFRRDDVASRVPQGARGCHPVPAAMPGASWPSPADRRSPLSARSRGDHDHTSERIQAAPGTRNSALPVGPCALS
jgi:hypothetical protein